MPETRQTSSRVSAAERFGIQVPRARWQKSSKSEQSRARSGQLHGRVRCSGRQPSGCRPHTPTTTAEHHARHNGRAGGTTHIGNHTLHNGPCTEPRAVGITLHITSHQHTGLPYRTLHNGQSAERAIVPHPHNALLRDGAGTPRLQKRDSPHHIEKELLTTRPGHRTDSVSGRCVGRDSLSKREKPEARKKLKKRGAYPPVHCTHC
jgi:hypothetical protein